MFYGSPLHSHIAYEHNGEFLPDLGADQVWRLAGFGGLTHGASTSRPTSHSRRRAGPTYADLRGAAPCSGVGGTGSDACICRREPLRAARARDHADRAVDPGRTETDVEHLVDAPHHPAERRGLTSGSVDPTRQTSATTLLATASELACITPIAGPLRATPKPRCAPRPTAARRPHVAHIRVGTAWPSAEAIGVINARGRASGVCGLALVYFFARVALAPRGEVHDYERGARPRARCTAASAVHCRERSAEQGARAHEPGALARAHGRPAKYRGAHGRPRCARLCARVAVRGGACAPCRYRARAPARTRRDRHARAAVRRVHAERRRALAARRGNARDIAI
jgi:hypothetical protein